MASSRSQTKRFIKNASFPVFYLLASIVDEADGSNDRHKQREIAVELVNWYDELRIQGNHQKHKPIKAAKYFKWLFISYNIDVLGQLERDGTPEYEAVFVAAYDFLCQSLAKDLPWSDVAPELVHCLKGA